jgi:hypothetical protein
MQILTKTAELKVLPFFYFIHIGNHPLLVSHSAHSLSAVKTPTAMKVTHAAEEWTNIPRSVPANRKIDRNGSQYMNVHTKNTIASTVFKKIFFILMLSNAFFYLTIVTYL